MTITALPTAPSTSDPTTFASRMDAWIAALATWTTEANATAAALNAIAAGGALTIPYTFSTTTTDADPGAGYLRLDNATQASATTIRADLVGADTTTYTDMLVTFDDSTSTIKGFIMLQSLTTPARWLLYSVSALASPSGYKNITVAYVAGPGGLTNNESITLKFTRTGDAGSAGTGGVVPLSELTISNQATADIETTFDSTYDSYMIDGWIETTGGSNPTLMCRLKIGGSYLSTGTYHYHSNNSNAGASAYSGAAATTGNAITMTGALAASEMVQFVMFIHKPTSTTHKKHVKWSGSAVVSGNVTEMSGAGGNTGTGALTGVRFYTSADNLVAGKLRLSGIKQP